MSEKIEILIAKYFSEGLSSAETQRLIYWIEASENNKRTFNDYIVLNFTIEQLKSEGQDDSLLWKHIVSSFKVPVRKLTYWKYTAAASALLIIALTIFINKDKGVEFIKIDTPIIVNNNIEIGSDKAILTLEDGSDIILEKGKTYLTNNIRSNGEKIVYTDVETSAKAEITYNYLTIPRGGQFYIELSDDTKVWLNSDSKIKYPKIFLPNQNREVELVYGEAYFDVSSSANHNGSKFKVFTNGQEVEVLGTEFNIKAYQDEDKIFTTLVEGKVHVTNGINEIQLIPKQQSIMNTKTLNIDVAEVNVYNQVSWKDGVFSFKSMSLKDIMKVMERWYDVEVEFENKELQGTKFIGVFRKDQNIEHILRTIKNTNFINTYEIDGKKIIFK